MSRGRNKSGLITNVDSKLTPAQRKQAETDAYNDGIIQDAIVRADKTGPPVEVLNSKQNFYTTFDRLAEKSSFASGDKTSLIPLAVRVGPEYPGGFHYVLSDADYDAVMAGFYCFYCLERHSDVWQPACVTCGADRDLISR